MCHAACVLQCTYVVLLCSSVYYTVLQYTFSIPTAKIVTVCPLVLCRAVLYCMALCSTHVELHLVYCIHRPVLHHTDSVLSGHNIYRGACRMLRHFAQYLILCVHHLIYLRLPYCMRHCVCCYGLGKSGGQIRGSSIDPPQSAGTTADHTLRPHSGPASYDFGQANFMSALEGKDWPMHAAAQDDRYNIELGHPQRLRFDGTLPHNRHNDVAGIVSGICLRMPQLPSIAET